MRKPTKLEAFVPIISMLLLLGIGYGYLKLPIQVLLLLAAFVAFIIGKRVGLTWDDMLKGINDKVSSSMTSIFVMICVGALIGSWMISGIIPMMIYYGIQIINPRFLLVTAFIVTAIISSFTGTSFGSAGTAGVAIMGIAYAQGIPLQYAAGAVISGAVFGDKISPFSDTTILAPIAAGCNLYEHIKHLLYTTGSATILSLIVFGVIGFMTPVNSLADTQTVQTMLNGLSSIFKFNIFMLIPPLVVFIGAYSKKPIIPMLLLSSSIAVIFAVVIQGFDILTALDAFLKGFNVEMLGKIGVDSQGVMPKIVTLLNRGGMMGMMSTVLLILCAFSFAGIVSRVGCMEVILSMIVSKITSVGNLILSTVVATILMSIVTGSSYLAILIPGEMFKDLYKRWGLHAKNLSRTLEDSGTCVVPLVPWSIAGIYMSTTLGVPTLEYLPFAVLCYSSFIFAIIFGYTGFGITRIKKEKKVQQ